MKKMARSFEEITISDYTSMRDINLNWRGFESYQGLQAYMSGRFLEYIFGHGFGTLIDLGFFMAAENINMQQIPILHNGYLYILVKTGLIGLTLYFYFLIKLFRMGKYHINKNSLYMKVSGHLLTGLSLLFFTTTFAITGIFNKNALFSATLLLGCLLYYYYFINTNIENMKRRKTKIA
jgi:O-antigen ligase